MNWKRAIVISLAITLALMAVLGGFSHGHVFGLFLLLPLGFLLRSKPKPPQAPRPDKPIEPK